MERGGYGHGNPNEGPYGSGGGGGYGAPASVGYGGGPAPYGSDDYAARPEGHHERPQQHYAPEHYPNQPTQPLTAYHSGQEPPQYGQRTEYSKSPSSNEEFYKVVCEANPSFYLTDRNGTVVLAPGDESNPHQQWIKDTKMGSRVKDEAGFPAFSLVNKASGLFLSHDKHEKVLLSPKEQHSNEEATLWTQSADVGHGYQCIRPISDSHINLDADHGDKEHGGVKDGTKVMLHKWNKQENQKWKILPISTSGRNAQQNYGGQIVKLSCEAKHDYYVTIRGNSVVLAAPQHDGSQEWIKDDKVAANMKDESGAPAFALINKVTRKALQHGGKEFDKVVAVPYEPSYVDDSVLWTLSGDVGRGYKCLRPVRDVNLNLDASHGDDKHGGIHDGTELILYKWLKRENQKWRLTFLCKY